MNTPMDIGAQSPGLSTRMIALGARWMSGRAMFRDGVAKSFFTPSALAQNSAYEDAFHGMLRRAKPKQLSAAIRSVMLRGSPLIARIADISMPTLIIAGKDDGMYPINRQKRAASLIIQGQFEAVDGKHISVVEQLDTVGAIVSRFVTQTNTH